MDEKLAALRPGHRLLGGTDRRFCSLYPLHEQLLSQAIRVLHEFVVVPFADFADARELLETERPSRFTKGLERVLGLARQDDIAHELQEIVFANDVGKVTSDAHGDSGGLFGEFLPLFRQTVATGRGKRSLIFLKQTLVLGGPREESHAQIPEALVFRLGLVVLERLEECPVHGHRIRHLTSEKVSTALHGSLRLVDGRTIVQFAGRYF
jgi:hypothetical protein